MCVCGVYRAQEARRRQRYSAKSHYEAGVWNVNTVTMGGLGGDPEASSDEGITTPAFRQPLSTRTITLCIKRGTFIAFY